MKELIQRYPILQDCQSQITAAEQALIRCYEKGGKLLICGNGGSCADADHIVGELMKGFLKRRPLPDEKKEQMRKNCGLVTEDILEKLQGSLPAISLPSFTALNTAFCNDVDPDLLYAQALLGLGREGDVLLAVSTSGNAENVYHAAVVAKSLGITVIGLTGRDGGRLRGGADISVCAPETQTYRIQELHLPIYHFLCAAVESHFFSR